MSIGTEIRKLNTNLINSYSACSNKGATMPDNQNFDNLAMCIDSISSGGGDPISPRTIVDGEYQLPESTFDFILPSTVTSLGKDVMRGWFYQNQYIDKVDFSSLTTIDRSSCLHETFYNSTVTSADFSGLLTLGSGVTSFYRTFANCRNLTSCDFSSLTSINGPGFDSTFLNCSSLQSIDFSSLTTMSVTGHTNSLFNGCTSLTSASFDSLITVSSPSAFYGLFNGCTSLSSVSFNNLTTIGLDNANPNSRHFYQAFNNCSNLPSISFPKLEKIYCNGNDSQGSFANNNKIQKLYFPKLDTITYGTGASSSNQTACKNIFASCDELTEIHFGAANQAAIEASPGYSTLWGRGAGNATVYFDL